MAGNLEGFALSPGNLHIGFLETDRTFCLRLRIKMSRKHLDGREKENSICMLMINLLVWGEARIKEGSLLI
jgi:hypothetical protein